MIDVINHFCNVFTVTLLTLSYMIKLLEIIYIYVQRAHKSNTKK